MSIKQQQIIFWSSSKTSNAIILDLAGCLIFFCPHLQEDIDRDIACIVDDIDDFRKNIFK